MVNTGHKVDNTEWIVLLLADVSQKISALDLDPVVLKHEPQVFQTLVTLTVEDTILLISCWSSKQLFEEVLGDRLGDHVDADSCREDCLNTA